MRKEADYQVTDKIFVKISAENIAKIADFVEMIENETLSTHTENIENADIEKEFEMEEFGKVKIAIKK